MPARTAPAGLVPLLGREARLGRHMVPRDGGPSTMAAAGLTLAGAAALVPCRARHARRGCGRPGARRRAACPHARACALSCPGVAAGATDLVDLRLLDPGALGVPLSPGARCASLPLPVSLPRPAMALSRCSTRGAAARSGANPWAGAPVPGRRSASRGLPAPARCGLCRPSRGWMARVGRQAKWWLSGRSFSRPAQRSCRRSSPGPRRRKAAGGRGPRHQAGAWPAGRRGAGGPPPRRPGGSASTPPRWW